MPITQLCSIYWTLKITTEFHHCPCRAKSPLRSLRKGHSSTFHLRHRITPKFDSPFAIVNLNITVLGGQATICFLSWYFLTVLEILALTLTDRLALERKENQFGMAIVWSSNRNGESWGKHKAGIILVWLISTRSYEIRICQISGNCSSVMLWVVYYSPFSILGAAYSAECVEWVSPHTPLPLYIYILYNNICSDLGFVK